MATKPKAKTEAQQSQENAESQSSLVQLGGLWANKKKDGSIYFSGYLGNAKLLIFRNNYKEQDKHPDFVMYVAENKPKDNVSSDDVDKALDDIPF